MRQKNFEKMPFAVNQALTLAKCAKQLPKLCHYKKSLVVSPGVGVVRDVDHCTERPTSDFRFAFAVGSDLV